MKTEKQTSGKIVQQPNPAANYEQPKVEVHKLEEVVRFGSASGSDGITGGFG